MKPQPPVTKMRIAARTSSAPAAARADSAEAAEEQPGLFVSILESDWMFWAILGLAALLRLLLLGIKPPHFDEGINGWFVDQMVKNGFYRYDPTNYHGPLHFYILFLSESLLGRNLWALRLPVVLASIASVWLALRYELVLPRRVARLAALAMAVSPGFVFYGRYSIHEAWLLLFSMLFMLGLFGLWRRGSAADLWCAGMGLTGMVLTKETYIIHVGCALLAWPLAYLSHRITPVSDWKRAAQSWSWLDLAVVTASGIILILFFYSGTFLNWGGVKGLYQTFHAWFKTGENGNGHEKPFYYWLKLVGRYEWPVTVGLLLCGCCQFFRNVTLRYLAITGAGVFAAYSIVHYKTPWCIISIVWPLLFLFGGFLLLVPPRFLSLSLASAFVLLSASLGYSVVLNYFRCTTDSEPYVYVQTYNEISKLTDPLLTLAHADPVYYHLTGHLIRPSPYPLPWILGDFSRVGYYEHDNLPPELDADFLLVQEDKVNEVEAKLHDRYYTGQLTIRPYQDPSKLYLRASVFGRLFPGRPPEFVGKP